MFSDHSLRLISLSAKDHIRKNCNTSDVLQAQYRKQSDQGNYRGISRVTKSQSQCKNSDNKYIYLSDRLIDGKIDTVKYTNINQIEVNATYVAFDDASTEHINKWK